MHRAAAIGFLLVSLRPQPVLAHQAATAAQTPVAVAAASPSADDAVDTSLRGGAMQLDVVVADKSGNPVPGLSASDFTLLDNGKPSGIVAFRALDPATLPEREPPAKIILVIDTVNDDFNSVAFVRAQVQSFLRQNQGRLAYPVSVDWITDKEVKTQDTPTLDGNALADKLAAMESQLRTIVPSQGLYGAVDRLRLCLQILRAIAVNEAARPGKKLLVWIGPGWPMLGGPNLDMSAHDHKEVFAEIVDLSARMREARISLYSVSQGQANYNSFLYEEYLKGVRHPEDSSLADLSLKVLAVQTGGLAETPTNDLAASIDACVRGAGTFYRLAFVPPPPDAPNEYHKLEVRIDRPNLKVRTSTGYYSQPASAPAAP
jgi:VWFA-related protein